MSNNLLNTMAPNLSTSFSLAVLLAYVSVAVQASTASTPAYPPISTSSNWPNSTTKSCTYPTSFQTGNLPSGFTTIRSALVWSSSIRLGYGTGGYGIRGTTGDVPTWTSTSSSIATPCSSTTRTVTLSSSAGGNGDTPPENHATPSKNCTTDETHTPTSSVLVYSGATIASGISWDAYAPSGYMPSGSVTIQPCSTSFSISASPPSPPYESSSTMSTSIINYPAYPAYPAVSSSIMSTSVVADATPTVDYNTLVEPSTSARPDGVSEMNDGHPSSYKFRV
ncbi:hypothetical protein EJ02DRAFT_514183 [Clathrospora elynae]|uniref:Ig-like domain-containing protein n=1 Tax=Clathrospora elynae TaxID=706981 RepID=A0A6A5SE60_9PLEO|nr:hypothetical protein EJ02DRAFT_514183 [Clathrospora elynae]